MTDGRNGNADHTESLDCTDAGIFLLLGYSDPEIAGESAAAVPGGRNTGTDQPDS